jgi:hypothetical protein
MNICATAAKKNLKFLFWEVIRLAVPGVKARIYHGFYPGADLYPNPQVRAAKAR